jgi:nucleoside-diphosphate-sugar epimerase
MAFSRFIAAIEADQPLTVYGDGQQRRDFTFVDDIVVATLRAATAEPDGLPINVGGGVTTTVCEVLHLLGQLLDHTPRLCFEPVPPGDMRSTHADLSRAAALLGYAPQTGLRQGLERQIAWSRSIHNQAAPRATAALLSLRR